MTNFKHAEDAGARVPRCASKIAIVVAGMHRSGTSALTRVLNRLGCDLPNTLLSPSPNDNELGFWESRPIMDLNQEILASAGSHWIDWAPFNPAWHESPVSSAFHEQAQSVLRSEYGTSRFFILKDPRNCRLLRFWTEALEVFGACPVVVMPVRNPLEVAASLNKRNKLDPAYCQLAWLRHVLEAEAASRDLPRVVTHYDGLLAQWGETTDRIAASLGFAWPRRSLSAEIEIEDFLSPRQRHHVESDQRVLQSSRLSPWIRETYEILLRWSRADTRDADMAALDRIRASFDQAAPAFEGVIVALEAAGSKMRTLEASLQGAERAYK